MCAAKAGWTTLGLDEAALQALKDTILSASLYADELLGGDEVQVNAAHSMHEDIELLCEVLGTDLDGLWHEFELAHPDKHLELAKASTARLERDA